MSYRSSARLLYLGFILSSRPQSFQFTSKTGWTIYSIYCFSAIVFCYVSVGRIWQTSGKQMFSSLRRTCGEILEHDTKISSTCQYKLTVHLLTFQCFLLVTEGQDPFEQTTRWATVYTRSQQVYTAMATVHYIHMIPTPGMRMSVVASRCSILRRYIQDLTCTPI